IEKAHPSVFDLLLQVLGEARLTDGRGRTTFFHNAIIVLTSNLGTRGARGTLGLTPAVDAAAREDRRYRDAVMGAFRPELINRLDQIVVFHPLVPAEIQQIARIAVARLAERRGLTQSGVTLDISERALDAIAERGFSPELGARALRRYLDTAVLAPAARLLARAGAEAHGGALTVRRPDEVVAKPAGAKLGDATVPGEADLVTIALWRRAAQTGRRMVRSALALGGLRRETDRELAHPLARGVQAKIAELEATLATAVRKKQGRAQLPGAEIARLQTDHARLVERWAACATGQAELRTAEELCLEALARDVDAIDLIDGAIAQRDQFRRDLFWLLVALRPSSPGATLLVHTPDARAALVAWLAMVLEAADAHRMRASVHIWGEQAPGWHHPWGPGHDLDWVRGRLAAQSSSALVRIHGAGADQLFGLEQGLHRFHGLVAEPSHVWVDLVEPKAELSAVEWTRLPGAPTPRPARGSPMREVTIAGGAIIVGDDEVDVPWSEAPTRLAELAVTRLLAALARTDGGAEGGDLGELWKWTSPSADASDEEAP
ncbi:MAG: AAA family ATPase, partial [Proteobacteria bacterium]|nr:AAA family ATPase [Pseudomonadota bacterium]